MKGFLKEIKPVEQSFNLGYYVFGLVDFVNTLKKKFTKDSQH